MKRYSHWAAILGAFFGLFASGGVRAAAPARDDDNKAMAARILANAGPLKEGEVVLVRGYTRDAALLEAISLAARKIGAVPIVLMSTPDYQRRWFEESPARYDANAAEAMVKLLDVASVDIELFDYWLDTKYLSPERAKAADAIVTRVEQKRLARGVRLVGVGNGLYPSDLAAKMHGMSKAELAKVFWDGVATDPARLAAQGAALRAALSGAKVLKMTSPKGTHFSVRIEGRPIWVSDGRISPEAMETGGAAIATWLPAGEAYLTPVPGTAEGKLVVDRMPYEDGVLENVEVTFAAGKITALTAKPSKLFDLWKARYDVAPACRDELGVVDFGLNPDLKVKPGKKLLNYVVAGNVTFVLGQNTWAGGTQACAFGAHWFVPGLTVTADGKTVVENGELKAKVESASK